ncbi:ATP-binding protein [Janthinobacterium agaricidamnosum]|uniref:ATP-binding protein n=1 Tax=Janthinobacterium agaricidamnosum TaxID=55508 RepID=A0A3G2E9T2_9BURK|nr:ATP-binding protein [Janthinobacterium agaricidamnosum]AYM76580.1 ATP-binding protein [Janthinobacterium agaricidamnosum]
MRASHIDPDHCIFTKQYAVYTQPIHEMTVQIGDWIDQQRPGGYIYGASRLGKTRAIIWYLADVLAERFGAIVPLIIWDRSDSLPTEAAFWHQLLVASNFQFVDPRKPAKKTEGAYLCLQRFISIAKNAGRNYVVLVIDEAQEMTLHEWKWLVGLQNRLDYSGILLSVFSIGSHQLGYRHEYLASTGNAHIAARFMAAHARFHGIRTLEEIRYVLNNYDVDSEWPAGSGISFLNCFAPTSFAQGKRLVDCAEYLWRALIELRPASVKNYTEFPMQHIARTVEEILSRLSHGEDWNVTTSYESWLNELAKVNYSDHMRIIATAG